jgi:hypothetical protein
VGLVARGPQQFLPAVGPRDIARAQLGRHAVARVVKQQPRMLAGGLEVAVVGALRLPPVDRHLGAVHLPHYPPPSIDGCPRGDQLPIERGQTCPVCCWRQQFGFQ